MTECFRCHYEGPIICEMTINGSTVFMCPECVLDFQKFLCGRTLNERGVIVCRGFKSNKKVEE